MLGSLIFIFRYPLILLYNYFYLTILQGKKKVSTFDVPVGDYELTNISDFHDNMAVLYNRLRIKPKILLRRSYRRILSMLLFTGKLRRTSKAVVFWLKCMRTTCNLLVCAIWRIPPDSRTFEPNKRKSRKV